MNTVLVIKRELHNIDQSALGPGSDWKCMIKFPLDEK